MEEGQEILDKRYKVIKKLGGGAFGELYKVEKRKTGDFLAAKVEKAVKNAKHIMLFWESKLIHKLRGKPLSQICILLVMRRLKMGRCTMSWSWTCWVSHWKIYSKSAEESST